MYTREQREQQETQVLAPYAARSGQSHGREHEEAPHAYRTEFQRDRDRVIHCRAFRRLEYKTQVFVNWSADHYRTRLTHTIEMAAIGRTLARALGVNEDLAEAIALAHDIGHSPFGHCGERALDELMKGQGGFDHNLQSLRWVEYLESPYPEFNGLNLTWEVRAGLRKHQAAVSGAQLDGRPIGPFQAMEAQIADVADDISYHAADVEDGIEAGLVDSAQLEQLELWHRAADRARQVYAGLSEKELTNITIRNIFDYQVEDVVNIAAERLKKYNPVSPQDVMNAPERIVDFSPELKTLLEPYRAFLFREIYWRFDATSMDVAVKLMRKLFFFYMDHPDEMGRKARARIDRFGLWRSVCDYVSGMTDRYAMMECEKHGLTD
jgi:dGTPase